MPRYAVDVKVFINVLVEADTPEQARSRAEAWVDWISPTDEQLQDYLSDHPDAGIAEGGTLAIDGESDVEEE